MAWVTVCASLWFGQLVLSLPSESSAHILGPLEQCRHRFPVTRLDKSTEDCEAIARSLKYSESCGDTEADPMWPVLITSVGSSGTQYMAKLLNKFGFRVTHDNGLPGPDGAVSWVLAFNNRSHAYSDFVGPNFPPKGRFKKVLLQVRDPLAVMNSRLAGGGLGEWFIDYNTAVKRMRNVYNPVRAVEHWVSWNMHILRYSDWIYRIEDVDIGELCVQAGFGLRCPSKSQIAAAKASLPTTTHHHEQSKEPLTWGKLQRMAPLMTELAMDLGSLFGYNTSSAVPQRPGHGRRLLEDGRSQKLMTEVQCVVDLCQSVREYWQDA